MVSWGSGGCVVTGMRAVVGVPATKAVGLALYMVDGFGVWVIEVGSVCIWRQSVRHTVLDEVM